MKLVKKNCNGFEVPIELYSSLAEAICAVENIPSDSPIFVTLASAIAATGTKGETAVLTELNNNLYYRGAAPDARALLASAIEDVTGIPRPQRVATREKKDENGKVMKDEAGKSVMEEVIKDGKPVMEPSQDDTDFVKWAVAKAQSRADHPLTDKQLQELVDGWFAGIRTNDKGEVLAPKFENGTFSPQGDIPYIIRVDVKPSTRAAAKPKRLSDSNRESARLAIQNKTVGRVLKSLEKLTGKPYAKPDGTEWTSADESSEEAVGWMIKAWLDARNEEALLMATGRK